MVAFAKFASVASPTANQVAYVIQARDYHKTPIEMSFSASAAIAGFLAGPLLLGPGSLVIGRCAMLFWSLVCLLATQIWAASMTREDQYIPFVISRLFAGAFGGLPIIIGSGFIIDVFFLHQRGRVFAIFEICFLFGIVVSPTFGGFVVSDPELSWPWTFWWTIPLLGVAALLVLFLFDDTGFDREICERYKPAEGPVLQNITLFLFGWRVVAPFRVHSIVSKVRTSVLGKS